MRQGLLGRAGRNVTVEASDRSALVKFTARWSPDDNGTFKRLVIERTAQGFASRMETAPLSTSSRLTGGTIQSSLFAATDDANIPDAIATQVAEIFQVILTFTGRFERVTDSLLCMRLWKVTASPCAREGC